MGHDVLPGWWYMLSLFCIHCQQTWYNGVPLTRPRIPRYCIQHNRDTFEHPSAIHISPPSVSNWCGFENANPAISLLLLYGFYKHTSNIAEHQQPLRMVPILGSASRKTMAYHFTIHGVCNIHESITHLYDLRDGRKIANITYAITLYIFESWQAPPRLSCTDEDRRRRLPVLEQLENSKTPIPRLRNFARFY